jgi:glycerol uptake facilitator protein
MYSNKPEKGNMKYQSEFMGECIGTLILVFFGCGSVATTILFASHVGLLQVAIVWGIGVTLSIFSTRHLSCAHLNPAVSVAMVVGRRMNIRRLPVYLIAQFAGAFLAAGVLYLLFSSSIARYENLHHIVRGTPESIKTAMMFGEFYPNPGAFPNASVSMSTAFAAEGIGTFALVFFIFSLTEGCNVGRPDDSLVPIFIGLAVTVIISIIAPLTQAGLNPARDFSPRMFSMLAGWGKAALPDRTYGFLWVYILGPVFGGVTASVLFIRVVEPVMRYRTEKNNCSCKLIDTGEK